MEVVIGGIKLLSDEEELIYYVHYWRAPRFTRNISTGLPQIYLSRLAYLASFIRDNGEPQFADYHPEEGCSKIQDPCDVGRFMNVCNAGIRLWWEAMEKDHLIIKHGNEYAINENYFYVGDMPEFVKKKVLAGEAKVCAVPKYLIRELYHSGIDRNGADLSLFLRVLPCIWQDGKLHLPELLDGDFTPLKTIHLSQYLHNRTLMVHSVNDPRRKNCEELIYQMLFITVGAGADRDFLFQFEKKPLGKRTLNRVVKIKDSGKASELLKHDSLISLKNVLSLIGDTVIVNPKVYKVKEE